MRRWFQDRWRGYVESLDPAVAMAGSTPSITVFVVATMVALLLALAYMPPLAEAAQLQHVWVGVGFTLAGGGFTYLGWRHEFRGTVGALANLLDIAFYSAALALAAVNSEGTVAISLSLVYGLMLALFPGQQYGFSLLLTTVIVAPLLLMFAVFQPPLSVMLITACSTLTMLLFTVATRNKRQADERERHLAQALDATRELADEGVQTALTTTLLTLGHFVHELANCQAAVAANLEYVSRRSQLDERSAQALEDARQAQVAQERLLASTVADLKRRAKSSDSQFLLGELLQSVTTMQRRVKVELRPSDTEFEVLGNPEHLRVVLLNLVRNAEDALARNVVVEWQLESGGHAARISISNDGEPIPPEDKERLFTWFLDSSKPGGSGLGLYLCRRYIQLLGGDISVDNGALGGADFRIQLPGRAPQDRASGVPLSVTTSKQAKSASA